MIYLQPGDIVEIVAPSSKCHPSVLNKVRELLNSWGLHCHIPDDLFGDSLLYANSDEKRFEHLKQAIFNDKSKAIWCLLGGFGATKLIPLLSALQPPEQAKMFIGLSDITALHIFLQGQWGWTTIHGPSAYQACLKKVADRSIDILKKIIFRQQDKLRYEEVAPLNPLAQATTRLSAPLIGGNLHLIQASLGTSWQINAANKILFMEEINERAYRIDRIFTHLNQIGIIQQAKAILLGDFIDKGEPDGRFLVKETVQQFADRCPLPVFQISHVGHGEINNPIFLGKTAKLDTDKHSYLEFPL
jgi:muramoyltetrapeptide carboxypeptidase